MIHRFWQVNWSNDRTSDPVPADRVLARFASQVKTWVRDNPPVSICGSNSGRFCGRSSYERAKMSSNSQASFAESVAKFIRDLLRMGDLQLQLLSIDLKAVGQSARFATALGLAWTWITYWLSSGADVRSGRRSAPFVADTRGICVATGRWHGLYAWNDRAGQRCESTDASVLGDEKESGRVSIRIWNGCEVFCTNSNVQACSQCIVQHANRRELRNVNR
jgi:hypothetical protein